VTLDVVVVAFHSGAVLRTGLAAVEAFAPDARIIVVDNSPSDPSAAEAVADCPAAELVPERENVGFAAAVNDALARCSADVVLLANPDIVSLSGSLEPVSRIFEANPRAAAVTVRIVDGNGVLQHCRRSVRPADLFGVAVGLAWLPQGLRRRLSPVLLDWDHRDERVVDQATGALLFLRRAAVDDVGVFDDRFFMYWEETDWLERARGRGWQLVFTPMVEAVHAVSGSTDDPMTRHSLLLIQSTYVYASKHFGRAVAAALRGVWLLADGARLAAALTKTRDYRATVLARLRVHLGGGVS
jgi:GT2 family glycosyltransferase